MSCVHVRWFHAWGKPALSVMVGAWMIGMHLLFTAFCHSEIGPFCTGTQCTQGVVFIFDLLCFCHDEYKLTIGVWPWPCPAFALPVGKQLLCSWFFGSQSLDCRLAWQLVAGSIDQRCFFRLVVEFIKGNLAEKNPRKMVLSLGGIKNRFHYQPEALINQH